MSAAQLSRLSGLSTSHISRIFSGDRGVGIETLQKFAKALHLPPEIVYKAAGISLTTRSIKDARAERLASLIEGLSEYDQEIIDSLIETLHKRGERRKNGTGKLHKETEITT